MRRPLQILMTCLAFITLAPQAANANEQQFGEKFGVLFKLAGTWTTATPGMSKQLGEMMKGKPGDYFVRRDPVNPSDTQIIVIRKLAGNIPNSQKAIHEFCIGQRQKRTIDRCGAFSFGSRNGLQVVPRYSQHAGAAYMLQLDNDTVVQFGIVSTRDSFPVLRQQMEIALGELQYIERK